jgi:parallel beta-helix repeat protein
LIKTLLQQKQPNIEQGKRDVVLMKRKASALIIILALLGSAISEETFVKLSNANFIPQSAPEGIQITNEEDIIGKIYRDGDTYALVSDVNETIVVNRNNIVIDGSGHKLIGNGGSTGIFLQGVNNVTLKNLLITNFKIGITLTWGWGEIGARAITISGNILRNNSVGIELNLFTGDNILTENIIENGDMGIAIHYSSGNRLRNNQISGNKYNFYVDSYLSGYTSDFINDIDESNTIDGKPIIYWVNQQDKVVPSNAGYVALVGCKNITVQGLCMTNNSQGVLMVATNYSSITGNRLKNNMYGIVLFSYQNPCIYNTITANIIAENEEGIRIWVDWERNDLNNHNVFHHNSLINNTVQVAPYSYGGIWDDGSKGNYWSNYNGTDTNGDDIGDSPYVVIASYSADWDPSIVYGSTDIDRYPLVYPWGAPYIFIICPKNETYSTSNVSLNFTVDEPNSWISYSLDGNENIPIRENATLPNLSEGSHTLTVYSADMYGNVGASETIYFTVANEPEPEPFPTTLVAVASAVSVSAAGLGFLFYFKKSRTKNNRADKVS